jgi:hypothetical protein
MSLRREAGQEMLDQERNVVGAFAQRRYADDDDGDPVVQILAERAQLDTPLRVLVGRRDEPDVDSPRFGSSDLHELARLDDAQQLRLERRAQLRQLVDEEGARVRPCEDALAMIDGAGERAADVAEQVALEESLGHRRAIEGDEGAVPAWTARVDRAGDQLLSCPALAEDTDVRVARGDLLDPRQDFLDRLRAADQAVKGGDRRRRGSGDARIHARRKGM